MRIQAGLWRSKMWLQVLGAIGALASAGCAVDALDDSGDPEYGGEGATAQLEDGIIIGTNDLLPVKLDGSNVPEKYRPLLNGFGRAVYNNALCSATHVGNGIVVSAGHCFGAPATRVNNQSCAGGYVEWGRRESSSGTRTNCEQILAMQTGNGLDYAIYRVSPVPATKVGVQLSGAPGNGTPLTIFSHPGGRPLEWSRVCSQTWSSSTEIRYQCDTQGGSSGASVLRDDTLQIVALHWGGGGDSNIATKITSTPLAEFLSAPPPPPPSNGSAVVARHSGKCLDVASSGTADGTNIQQWDCNGTGAQRFSLRTVSSGIYEIVNANGKCVDVSAASTADGANIHLWTCNGTGAQRFRLQDTGGGFYSVVNVNSNKCMDVRDQSTATGANVQQWSCWNGGNQQWRFGG